MKELNYEVSKYERALIERIVERVMLCDGIEYYTDSDMLEMKIRIVHCNGNRLNLEALLATNDFAFYWDVFGIIRNTNLETGKLDNCFLPLFLASQIGGNP